MEPQPSQYPSAPQPATPGDVAPPPYRIHSITGVVLATFCGMPLGGSVVLAINYWRWGQKAYAVAVVTGGLLTTAVIAWLAFVLPAAVPALAFLVPQPVIAYVAGRWLQGHRTSPLTGRVMPSPTLIPNHRLRQLIHDMAGEREVPPSERENPVVTPRRGPVVSGGPLVSERLPSRSTTPPI